LDPTVNAPVLWPIIVYFIAVVLLVGIMLAISYVMGERHREKETGEPYESGITTTGSARIRLSAQFYLIAMFFVIFDLESAFVVAWAIAARELGWAGYAEILVFIGFLLAALIYLWRLGALDWSGSAARQRKLRQESSHQSEQ
jgi:NADH-quinone oxidoreductase subunit A